MPRPTGRDTRRGSEYGDVDAVRVRGCRVRGARPDPVWRGLRCDFACWGSPRVRLQRVRRFLCCFQWHLLESISQSDTRPAVRAVSRNLKSADAAERASRVHRRRLHARPRASATPPYYYLTVQRLGLHSTADLLAARRCGDSWQNGHGVASAAPRHFCAGGGAEGGFSAAAPAGGCVRVEPFGFLLGSLHSPGVRGGAR